MGLEPLYKCAQYGKYVYEDPLTTILDGIAHCNSCGNKREAKSLTPARITNYKNGFNDLINNYAVAKTVHVIVAKKIVMKKIMNNFKQKLLLAKRYPYGYIESGVENKKPAKRAARWNLFGADNRT